MTSLQSERAMVVRYWLTKYRSPDYHHGNLDSDFMNVVQSQLHGAEGVLDHGCGGGRVAVYLASLGHSLALCDVSGEAVGQAIAAIEAAGWHEKIAWSWVGFIDEVPGQATWDGFVSHRVLHCMPNDLRLITLHALANGVTSGGRGVITVRSSTCGRMREIEANPEYEIVAGERCSFWNRQTARFVHFFEKGEAEELVNSAGMSVIQSGVLVEPTGNGSRRTSIDNQYRVVVCRRDPR